MAAEEKQKRMEEVEKIEETYFDALFKDAQKRHDESISNAKTHTIESIARMTAHYERECKRVRETERVSIEAIEKGLASEIVDLTETKKARIIAKAREDDGMRTLSRQTHEKCQSITVSLQVKIEKLQRSALILQNIIDVGITNPNP